MLWFNFILGLNFLFFCFNPFTAKCSQRKISTRFPNFILSNFEKQIAPCVSTDREVSFEWSHDRISSTDSKVRVTLQTSIKYSGSERVKLIIIHYHAPKQKKITFKPRIKFNHNTYTCTVVITPHRSQLTIEQH